MPNPRYRRQTRTSNAISFSFIRQYYIDKTIQLNLPIQTTSSNIYRPTNKFEIIYQYFYDLIDAFSQQADLNDIIKKANDIINIFSEKEQVYQVIDLIENNIFSIVTNIYESTSISIITARLEYLKELLATIPANYDDYGRIADMLREIIGGIIDGFDFTSVSHSLGVVQQEMAADVALIEKFDRIQQDVLSIIQNIAEGVDLHIIRMRLVYLKTLIDDFAQ